MLRNMLAPFALQMRTHLNSLDGPREVSGDRLLAENVLPRLGRVLDLIGVELRR